MRKRYISSGNVNRLPQYLRILQRLLERGIMRTSSEQIGDMMDVTASLVRQDFSAFGSFGAAGFGYRTDVLKKCIENIIGLNKPHNIAVVGVGGIGKALLEHMDFRKYNYKVVGAFDIDSAVAGSEINGVRVYHMDTLKSVMERQPIDICMLSVSSDAAVTTAAYIHEIGIQGIWNFTGTALELPKSDVRVQDVNFWDSLFSLTYYIENKS